jgi:Fe-S-cluster containining protein
MGKAMKKTVISLTQLHTDIDTRVASIRENRPDWLCGKGCDSCCRRLAEVPQLSAAEWDFLQQGLAELSTEHLAQISRDMAALASQKTRPVVCPLLDNTTGACPVYAQRPVACRSYGFYVQRDKGLYCSDIESIFADGGLSDVVWGNHDAIDRQLAGLGESRSLTEWFAMWKRDDLPSASSPPA